MLVGRECVRSMCRPGGEVRVDLRAEMLVRDGFLKVMVLREVERGFVFSFEAAWAFVLMDLRIPFLWRRLLSRCLLDWPPS